MNRIVCVFIGHSPYGLVFGSCQRCGTEIDTLSPRDFATLFGHKYVSKPNRRTQMEADTEE